MNRPVRIRQESGSVVLTLRVHVEPRGVEYGPALDVVRDGIMQYERLSPYRVGEDSVPLRVELEWADAFALDCVNVRVYDKTPVIRNMLSPRINVSRAYFGTRRIGPLKLFRRLIRCPDVFINYGGKAVDNQGSRRRLASVVTHEFGHVLGFKDKYRLTGGGKRSEDVADMDIMYRTGGGQRPMEYHIAYLKRGAERGRLPLRRI